MIGITLSADQIRSAPPEVQHWIEHELQQAFGLVGGQGPVPHPATPQLVGCSVDEARGVLVQVQAMLPVMAVFFELGREATSGTAPSAAMPGLRIFRLTDLQRHARLQTVDQVVQCLDMLEAALREVRGDAQAMFFALDNRGYCIISDVTTRSVLHLWQDIVASRALGTPAEMPAVPMPPVAPIAGEGAVA